MERAITEDGATIPGIEDYVGVHGSDTGDECRARIAKVLGIIGVVEADVSNVAKTRDEVDAILKAAAQRAVDKQGLEDKVKFAKPQQALRFAAGLSDKPQDLSQDMLLVLLGRVSYVFTADVAASNQNLSILILRLDAHLTARCPDAEARADTDEAKQWSEDTRKLEITKKTGDAQADALEAAVASYPSVFASEPANEQDSGASGDEADPWGQFRRIGGIY